MQVTSMLDSMACFYLSAKEAGILTDSTSRYCILCASFRSKSKTVLLLAMPLSQPPLPHSAISEGFRRKKDRQGPSIIKMHHGTSIPQRFLFFQPIS